MLPRGVPKVNKVIYRIFTTAGTNKLSIPKLCANNNKSTHLTRVAFPGAAVNYDRTADWAAACCPLPLL